jgi:hypothetical protein
MTQYTSTRVGSPESGRYAQGDTFIDSLGTVFECFRSGYPGLWQVSSSPTGVGTLAAVNGLSATIQRDSNIVTLTFTLAAVQLAVTDAGGSGSYAGLKLFDFNEYGVAILGARQNYTAFAEGAALTTAAGDAVFEIGVGSVIISAAADGALGATNDNVCGDVNITNSGGTGAGTLIEGATAVLDGTTTAVDLNLNWSGTAATIDASSTIDVTGTIQVVLALLGDD